MKHFEGICLQILESLIKIEFGNCKNIAAYWLTFSKPVIYLNVWGGFAMLCSWLSPTLCLKAQNPLNRINISQLCTSISSQFSGNSKRKQKEQQKELFLSPVVFCVPLQKTLKLTSESRSVKRNSANQFVERRVASEGKVSLIKKMSETLLLHWFWAKIVLCIKNKTKTVLKQNIRYKNCDISE